MTPENFAYWLQGLLEVGKPETLDKEQVQQIKDHLQLVFKKETSNSFIWKDTPVPNPIQGFPINPSQSQFICHNQELPGRIDPINIPITC
jgi:hypothetical protein